ncbi:IPT/TIG domain-containing protein [Rufibacter roseus]|uniref:IPT/TIG domain-containing protein n=1 Tax=Rufibacter roseus TaxID=1567108 RepID=A0ABW2DNS9_9BACT|nr:IPT/TIG domain-containing protein [Rufibacter roseus]
MKHIYNLRAILLVCLLVSFGFFTSCSDDEGEINSGQVELLSFGPTGVKHGEQIKFIGRNLNIVESIEFQGATVAKTQFTAHTSELIELIVPQETEEGRVTLKIAGGEDVVSKTVLSFEVPVVINSFTESAKPGTNITITGNYLNWVDSVQFGSLVPHVKTFVSRSMTELVLTVPMEAKTGTLTFFTGGTEPMSIETEQELQVTLPNATGINPTSLKHGENLTITGTDLDLVKEVVFTGVGSARVSTFVNQSATQLVVTVPNNASTGTLKLVAMSGEEVTTTQTITVILPAITNMAPNPVDPGGKLTITGTNLDLVKTVNFAGGASVSTFISKTPTQIELTMPTADVVNGAVTFITTRDYSVATGKTLNINIERPPYFIFNDALHSEWQKWNGWGTTVQDMASTEQVSRGSRAIKLSYNDSYGALQLHPTNAKVMEGYTTLVLYVYGVTGDYQMSVALQLKDGKDTPDGTFMVKQGEWKKIEIPISTFGDLSAGINDFRLKNYGTNPNTVYVDDIELR